MKNKLTDTESQIYKFRDKYSFNEMISILCFIADTSAKYMRLAQDESITAEAREHFIKMFFKTKQIQTKIYSEVKKIHSRSNG